MDKKQIFDNWRADKQIDKSDLLSATLQTPELHEKYLRLYYDAKSKLRKLVLDHKNLTLAKKEFYAMGLTKETNALGWEYRPRRKLIKGEVKDWVEADPDVQKLYLEVSEQEDMVDSLKSIVDQIRDRHWTIKNAMDWIKWEAGAGG